MLSTAAQIKDCFYFPQISGAYQEIVEGGECIFGAGFTARIEQQIPARSFERKLRDYQLLRLVLKTSMQLGFDSVPQVMGNIPNLDNLIKSDEQSDLFVRRHLDRYFK